MNPESEWLLETGFDSEVDFCIWVLETDGLRIPPFDHHSEGNGTLQAAGMTEAAWQAWLTRVVLLKDSRLSWGDSQLQELTGAMLPSVEGTISRFSVEYPQFRHTFDRPNDQTLQTASDGYQAWLEEGYQQAISAARKVFGEDELTNVLNNHLHRPLDLWDGEAAVKEQLEELWRRYKSISFQREQEWERQDDRDIDSVIDKLWHTLTPYHSQIEALQLYFVSYPKAVEYLVPPVSAILSIPPEGSNIKTLKKQVLRAAQGLANAN